MQTKKRKGGRPFGSKVIAGKLFLAHEHRDGVPIKWSRVKHKRKASRLVRIKHAEEAISSPIESQIKSVEIDSEGNKTLDLIKKVLNNTYTIYHMDEVILLKKIA